MSLDGSNVRAKKRGPKVTTRIDSRPVLAVAAAVLWQRQEGDWRYLLGRRAPGQFYEGYWEFPGGKIEAGETPLAALQREMHEELGVVVETEHVRPWIRRHFVYPHAIVRIDFLHVLAWQGEIHAREHSELSWQSPRSCPEVSPWLPANTPVFRSLALPVSMWISNAASNGVTAEVDRFHLAMQRTHAEGLAPPLVQLREKSLSPDQAQDFASRLQALFRSSEQGEKGKKSDVGTRLAPRLVINAETPGGTALARRVSADGVHLTAATLMATTQRPDLDWVGASVHDHVELQQAQNLQLDYVMLGSVLSTASHPGRSGMGWKAFARLAEHSTIPIYALGGMSAALHEEAARRGAHGVALLSGF